MSAGAEAGEAGGAAAGAKASAAEPLAVVDPGAEGPRGLATIRVRGKEKAVCKMSLCLLSLDNPLRRQVLLFVEWRWFDRFILLCIVVNSILLGVFQHRAQEGIDDHYALNEFIEKTADHILWGIFSFESLLKIIAWGFILGKKTYLRDPWNALDFIVVLSGLIERCGAGGSLNFLRLFRLLRPLRSLNAVPQMKILVNTALSSILKLGNVIILGAFLFMVFAIVGLSLMNGIFYRQCHTTRHPEELGGCWSWNLTGDDRLCGGNHACAAGSFCGGHEADPDEALRPAFQGGRRGMPWCEGSEPTKLYPETDFVHFDNIGGALLVVFQSMTLEGWTDLMYMVEDSFSPWFAVLFFSLVVILTNFFMLNVALAVVDEVQDEFQAQEEQRREGAAAEEAEEEGAKGAKAAGAGGAAGAAGAAAAAAAGGAGAAGEDAAGAGAAPEEEPLWLNCRLVACCDALSRNEAFMNFILLIIFGNVVNMCLQWFSLMDAFGYAALAQAINVLEVTFLGIFIVEMVIMIIALGPKGYVMNPITCFDGVVVIISVIELVINSTSDGGGGGLSALRTFRLFRVMNKLATKWTKLKVLLKAMLHTGSALKYWLVLFCLVLYIFTLMWMSIFARSFHFEDADALAPLVPRQYHDQEWCPDTDDGRSWHLRQECIPRAHFDTFTWGFVTVFQVMTGENWNTIMYAGMRASQRWEDTIVPPTLLSATLFIIMILFGQTLFISLFVSMLISKFDDVQDQFEAEERQKRFNLTRRYSGSKGRNTSMHVAAFINKLKTARARPSGEAQEAREKGDEGDRDAKDAEAQEGSDEALPRDASTLNCSDVTLPQTPETLPGQMPPSPDGLDSFACSPPNVHEEEDEAEAEAEAEAVKGKLEQIPSKRGWPHSYALLVFSEANPLRKGARWLLSKRVEVCDTRVQVFDSVILVCILLSTLCMMADTPLSDPRQTSTQVLRAADKVFAVIFMAEMSVKLVAQGLAFGPGAYLKSGWNWLDGIVVLVSVVDLATGGEGPGFLRVLRILRTFRPLRVISRNEGLRVVVQTLFQSMGDLFGLVIVSSLFLLIFALVFLMYLKGALYQCEAGDAPVRFLRGEMAGLGDGFVTPLCVGADAAGLPGSGPRGGLLDGAWAGADAGCGAGELAWQRASADTPVCLARCNPALESHPDIEGLCHPKYRTTEELPSACPNAGEPGRALLHSTAEQEAVGARYVADMQRTLTLPCGGHAVDEASGQVVDAASALSCRSNFCLDTGEPSAACVSECANHEYFCKETCRASPETPACQACRRECEAACMCEDFCTPLVADAALCHEQGGSWGPVLSQDFDNIVNSMLTLFEISTTEGWVDVMYAASDFTDVYRQPVRDNNHGPYVFLFPLWILLSFMFLINLAVGVIVDNFETAMNEKEQLQQDDLTDSQRRWMKSRKTLHQRAFIYDLTNLHLLPRFRRKVYNLISSKPFEQLIMTSIVINTLIMALTIFPDPEPWWSPAQDVANYIFAGIYTVEAILKLIALRCNYWLDAWNRFDFVCVVATLVGIILKMPSIDLDLGAATSVIRILRIARLFRLLRFLKELNRLFMCLLISIPKLYNVMMILCLFLVLYSILGMSLFGTAKFGASDPTLNVHGNFQTFWRGFVTLFRASTGEAWNEIMHDLAKDEEAFFREGDWCTPQQLYKTRNAETFAVLEEKCLIESPNACPGSWNPMSAVFWVSYTLLITFMIMNLVVAVILKGYEEGKETSETDNIELCIEVWKKYDPDQKLTVPLPRALRFLHEVMAVSNSGMDCDLPVLQGSSINEMSRSVDMRDLTKFARLAVEMNVKSDEVPTVGSLQSEVTFLSASRQALRLMSMNGLSEEDIEEMNMCDDQISNKKELHQLKSLERKSTMDSCKADFMSELAAQKIQAAVRARRASLGSGSSASAHLQPLRPQPQAAEAPLRGAARGEEPPAAAGEAKAAAGAAGGAEGPGPLVPPRAG